LGSPLVNSAVVQLENGKVLEIEAVNQSPKNVYVKKVLVNGQDIKRLYITHNELMNGGKITFQMSSR